MKKSNPAYPYLKTLRLLDDDIILDMAARPMFMRQPCACICGTAIREVLCETATVPTLLYRNLENGEENIHSISIRLERLIGRISNREDIPNKMVELFGGKLEEWDRIYLDVESPTNPEASDAVELAFVTRVDEAVRRSSK